MRRQLDMPLDDALDYLRAQLSLAHVHRGHRRGRHRVLREARTDLERPLMSTARRPSSLLRPLVEELAGAPRADQARRRRGEDRPAARAGEADRARAPGAADRRGHVRGARHPRPPALLPARDGGPGRARRRRDHRLRQGRRAPGGRLRVRLHGDGGLDGDDRRDQGHAPARARADEADPVHLAARLGGRARSRRRSARCSRARDTCSARRS